MSENLHKGHRERLKNRFIDYGGKSFDDHQILELLLFYGIPRKDTNDIAHRLINVYGGFNNIFSSNVDDLVNNCDIGKNTAVLISLLSEIIRRYNENKMLKKNETFKITSSEKAGQYSISLLGDEHYEKFYIVSLDAQKRIINASLVGEGTSGEVYVYSRRIVEYALRDKAVSVLLIHNHPGGKLNPSFNDLETTTRIVKTLNMIDIDVIDHIIVSDNYYFSFADNGLIKNSI